MVRYAKVSLFLMKDQPSCGIVKADECEIVRPHIQMPREASATHGVAKPRRGIWGLPEIAIVAIFYVSATPQKRNHFYFGICLSNRHAEIEPRAPLSCNNVIIKMTGIDMMAAATVKREALPIFETCPR